MSNDRMWQLVEAFVSAFGAPREVDMVLIKHIAKSDWTIEEFAEWLRSTPEEEHFFDVTITADGYKFHRPPLRYVRAGDPCQN